MGDSRSGQWFGGHFPLARPAHCPAPHFVLNFAGHGRPAFTTQVRINGGGSAGDRPGGDARAPGHSPGLLWDDASVVELPATGLPLGLFSLAPTDARIVGLGQNGSLAVVSRGVVEAESKKLEFGLDGVKSVLQTGRASARDLSQRILQGVQDFMHMAPKHNDVTALTLTRGN